MYTTIRRNIDPANNNAGGSSRTVSLSELDADDDNFNSPVPITDGDSNEKPVDITKVKPTEDPKPELPKAPVEVKEDPKPKEEVKTDELDDETVDPENEDAAKEAEEFMAEVDRLRGDVIEVEYGDIDPLTPEGVVLREKAVAESAVLEFEAQLAEKYPKQYAYFLNAVSGKTDEEFFDKASTLEKLPSEEELQMNVDLQTEWVIKDLISKGNTEKQAKALVKIAIGDNELEEMAIAAIRNQAKNQAKVLEEISTAASEAENERTQAIKEMQVYVSNVVKTGKLGDIAIPEKDRVAFAQKFTDSIRYDNGKFLLVTEINNDNINQLFQKEFFGFKKGDLKEIVKVAAKTENVRRLKRTFPKQDIPQDKSDTKRTGKYTLSDLDAD